MESVPMTAEVSRLVVAPTNLPTGFRFHPSDEELVQHYLRSKVRSNIFRSQEISELDVYTHEPWELSAFSRLDRGETDLLFFCPVNKKPNGGSRINRSTLRGYWKASWKDRVVKNHDRIIGMKKTLVFYDKRGANGPGVRTQWVMHEYRLVGDEFAPQDKDRYVICKIIKRSAPGPTRRVGLLVPGGAPEEVMDQDPSEEQGNEIQTLDLFPVEDARPLKKTKSTMSCEHASTSTPTSSMLASDEELDLSLSLKHHI